MYGCHISVPSLLESLSSDQEHTGGMNARSGETLLRMNHSARKRFALPFKVVNVDHVSVALNIRVCSGGGRGLKSCEEIGQDGRSGGSCAFNGPKVFSGTWRTVPHATYAPTTHTKHEHDSSSPRISGFLFKDPTTNLERCIIAAPPP